MFVGSKLTLISVLLIADTVYSLLAKLKTVFGVIFGGPPEVSGRIKQIILSKITLSDKVPGVPANAKVSVPSGAKVIIPEPLDVLSL